MIFSALSIGALSAAVVASILAGPIGGAIGAAMGLHGAAAVSAGLAFLGGGSLADGGLGMAGGFGLLVGSGALIGGVGGVSLASRLRSIPENVLLLEMVEMYNYTRFLASRAKTDEGSQELVRGMLERFISIKHETEKDLLLGTGKAKDEGIVKALDLMNYTLKRLLAIL